MWLLLCDCSHMWLLLYVIALICDCSYMWLLLYVIALICDCSHMWLLLYVIALICDCSYMWLLLYEIALMCDCSYMWLLLYVIALICNCNISTRIIFAKIFWVVWGYLVVANYTNSTAWRDLTPHNSAHTNIVHWKMLLCAQASKWSFKSW